MLRLSLFGSSSSELYVEETYVSSRNPADGGGGLPPHNIHRGHAVNHDLYYNMALLKL
jgi:hypothetical protein